MPDEQSKFSGVLAKLKPRSSEQLTLQQPVLSDPSHTAEPVRGKGRPPGKRSDPSYQPTTVLLRKQTKKTAARLLEDSNSTYDLSDLIEQLLGEWIQQQT